MIDLASLQPLEVPVLRAALEPGSWHAGAFRARVFDALEERGWALLRGTGVSDAKEFAAAINTLEIETTERYGDLPHESGSLGVFRTTEYPPTETIRFHSEASHMAFAPRLIVFACLHPATHGGATPLSDNASAFASLPADIADALSEQGLRYERNFVPGLDVSWEAFFGTTEPDEVLAHATAEGIDVEWCAAGVLRTYARRRAMLTQAGGQVCLFQQIALHHPAFLDPELREALAEICGGVLPRNVTLGSGAPLPDPWAVAIHDAQCREAFSFVWEAGDILFVDNTRMSHARTPFRGARRHLVMLGRFSADLNQWEMKR
ncbi:TauD/TfdA family dioxygenase [Mesorhizobium sp. M0618]|uniref:TauD/TfdA family dioxygenase n=1 Tax=unclassified Mesorhizobium TaxID=325217 RepID=UPI00333C3272